MDLTISIRDRQLHYQTYQKEHNLYLYIPPLSAHPREMLRGLIFGRLRAYHKHNTDTIDYLKMASLLSRRLINRGWSWSYLKHIFNDAHNRITGRTQKPPRTTKKRPVFIHTTYHPRGIQRQDLRKIYNETLGQVLDNDVIVATSRPRNLRDILVQSKLPPVENCNPSDFLNRKNSTNKEI